MLQQCRVQMLVRCVVDGVKTDKKCTTACCIVGRVRKYDEMLSCDINLHKTKYPPTLQHWNREVGRMAASLLLMLILGLKG